MLIKPNLKDEKIVACLEDTYGLKVKTIRFLPLGADFNTAVYRITTNAQTDYFLKLRSGTFFEASVTVPQFLANLGVKTIIPPLATKTGQLWGRLMSFKTILYPFVEHHNGVEAKLSKSQWIEFGSTIKKLHSTNIPLMITKDIPRETFSSKWRDTLNSFLLRIQNEVFIEPVAIKMAAFLKSKRTEIINIIDQTEELAHIIKNQPLEYILCHADIHGWNLMLDKKDSLYIVDWDTLIFAPKERDLMFIGSGIWDTGLKATEEETLFYQGYGPTKVNPDLLSYYRFECIIQDISDYCEFIFSSDKGGDDRIQCLEHLQPVFLPNGALEKAYAAYKTRKSS